jgi:Putative adhesin
MNRLLVSIFVCAAIAAAQDKVKTDNVTVTLSDPVKPATVKVRLVSGNITVTVGSGPEVIVGTGVGAIPDGAPPGMHRIDTAGQSFKVEEDHNNVQIGTERAGVTVNLLIQVPVDTSLEVETTNGSIAVTNVSGAISARTLNGSVTVSLDHPPPDKPMFFSTLNGKIDVTLPADTKARLRMKATNGAIYSDFDVKVEADGTRSINGGGPEYSFQTTSGTILIHTLAK